MAHAYLLTNAIIYLVLALLCTVRHEQTARGTGYASLDAAGHSEYLVIYGGLQLGVALFFFLVARDAPYQRLGLLFSILFYASIVLYRVVTLAIYRPSNPVTLGTAGLEIALLIWGFLAWRNFGP